MSLTDNYVKSREKILNWVLPGNPDSILNPQRLPLTGRSTENSLASRIKVQLNKILALTLNENGKVDYRNLTQSRAYQTFRAFVGELYNFDYEYLSTREEKLAFWINLYNTLVVDAVIQEKIQTSVTESQMGILAFFQKAAYQVNGQRFSLTDIEHGVLRRNRGFPYFPAPHFGPSDPRREAIIQPADPRIHFALNCASNSCPPIAVYTPEKLDDQLDLAARNFINNNTVTYPDRKVISISRIFNWYQGDFDGKKGILEYLGRYIKDDNIKGWLSDNQSSIQIKYHPYDWGLNKIMD